MVLKNTTDWGKGWNKTLLHMMLKRLQRIQKVTCMGSFWNRQYFQDIHWWNCRFIIRTRVSDKGITCVETFDYDVVDKIYKPFDNLVMAVTLKEDGSTDKKVLGSLTEAVKAQSIQ